MTILPKKPTPASGTNSRPRTPPEENQRQDDFQLQGVSGGSVSSGWGPTPSSTSVPPNWNSSPSSSSPRWSQNGPATSREGEKRPACSPQPYEFNDDCGPASSKRRHRHGAGVSSVSRSSRSTGNKTTSTAIARPTVTPSPPLASTSGTEGGYNSEDEYSHLGVQLTEEEWQEKDRRFERMMKKKGYIIKKMGDDGSCLFRAVADQIFGDEEMHVAVRGQCMDYIAQNSDYFSQYVTEDLADYIERKRFLGVHGNHLEIQALSEMFNRPIHIYCYSSEPINIFHNVNKTDQVNVPIRLCYHREIHYNSLVDPNKPSIGVGLGLPNYKPGAADRSLIDQAVKASVESEVEKAMLEDKIKATDWEATNEVIEEQVARESYLQWLRDNERRNSNSGGLTQRPNASATATSTGSGSSSSTVTSGELRSVTSSPKPGPSSSSKSLLNNSSSSSPKAGCSWDRDSPKPGSSQQSSSDYDLGGNFKLLETASFLNGLPPDMFGLENWSDTDVITQVLAASQQEYLDSLKKNKKDDDNSKSKKSEEQQQQQHDTSKNVKKKKES